MMIRLKEAADSREHHSGSRRSCSRAILEVIAHAFSGLWCSLLKLAIAMGRNG